MSSTGSTAEHDFILGIPHFPHSLCQESSAGQSIFRISRAVQVRKPLSFGGYLFKEQSPPSSSGNTNLLMASMGTRGTWGNTFTVASRN